MPSLRRLFIALLPNAATQRQWASLVPDSAEGKRVPATNLHATLVFIGDATEYETSRYSSLVTRLSFAPFSILLNRFGFWKTSRVFWLSTDSVPSELLALVERLKLELQAEGFTPETRPFAFHITLMRQYRGGAMQYSGAPLLWNVRAVALMESISTPHGVVYRALAQKCM